MLADTNNQPIWLKLTWGWSHYWLMLLFTLVFHFPLLLPGMGMPPWGDFYTFHSPYRIAAAHALHSGDMPFLTQAILGGYPMYSDPQFAYFYPINLLFAALIPNPNSEVALDTYILINLIALSLSAVYFARSFGFGRLASVAAAIIMCMNGFVQMHITHINILQVMATGFIAGGLLARLAWSEGRQWRLALGAALALAAGNLAGHPQTTMFLHYALGIGMVVLAVKMWIRSRCLFSPMRILGWSAVAVVLGIALAAVQLLPTSHLLGISGRINMERIEAMDEAIRRQHLPSMLFPGFYIPLRWQLQWPFYVPEHIHWMTVNPLEGLTFCGVIAAALGLVGFFNNFRRWTAHVLFWGAMFLLAASVGSQSPVYGWMYDYLPMVRVVRVPSRVLWMFYTAWGVLAAIGIDAILRGNARRGAIRTLVTIVAMAWISALVLIGNYRTSWLQTFMTVFIDYHDRYDSGVLLHQDLFLRAIRDQAIVGAVFTLTILIFLWSAWRTGGRGLIAYGAVAALCIELFVYGFARSYMVDHPPTGKVIAETLRALPENPIGRAHVPHFVHGGGAINIAMSEGIRLAGGYSVTYPNWIKLFEPADVPPWRYNIDDKLLDIWNVSDIIVRRRLVPADVGPFKAAPVDDWGWTEIGSPWTPNDEDTSISIRGLMPSRLVIELDNLTTPVTQMYTLVTTARTIGFPDGTEIARLHAVPRDNAQTTITFPLRLGIEVSDSRHDDESERGNPPAHSKASVAYKRSSLFEWTDNALIYAAHHDLPTTISLERLVFEATGPFPTILGVNQIYLFLEDGQILSKLPMEIDDFRKVEIDNERYHLLHRDRVPGYVWMVPEAEYGSYKNPYYVFWRMSNRDYDPARRVIVDKRQYDPENAEQLDATQPDNFRGTATATWHKPEELTIRTSANDRGWMVLSMAWDKGWSAWVDGEPVELGRGNGPHCTLPLTAGDHEVYLRYRPVYWWQGATVTMLSLVIVIAGFAWPWRRRLLRRSG